MITPIQVKAIFVTVIILFCAAQSALAGDAVRDHRGPNGDPQGGVTVNGSATEVGKPPPHFGCEKCKGGFSGLSGSGDGDKGSGNTGATIRDHR